MSEKELSKVYEPHEVEDRWIDFWLKNDIFKADLSSDKEAFSIVIPPPNVTGSLHMGHALNSTLQDIMVRYHRMKGHRTLWIVGTDHAGIATQNVVERQLKEEGKSRFDLGREKFIERVWKWREESGGTIINQLKRLGASCDYSNERFTMDDGLSAAVRKVFVQLYNEGLIYRGERLINWCPRCHTALSDLEVEHENQKGSLWHFRYVCVDDPTKSVVVATTRPETLFGDTAVAVHPEDERYKDLIGKEVQIPLNGAEIPVIADDYVDQDFGSGVVKITPAHDFNDYDVGERHNLERINIFDESAKLNQSDRVPQDYQFLDRFEARKKIIQALEESGELVETEKYQNSVGHCYRCKSVVEPYLSKQWFVKTESLAKEAIDAVKIEKTRFIPKHWEKTYFNWMENIQDWCVSRQIWWGHQIPAWYCEDCNTKEKVLQRSLENRNSEIFIVAETKPESCEDCGSKNFRQETDVLDTWFSSGLWPFSTLGWPEQTEKLKVFYPTSVLVTAFDIIFFWVARMMMMGLHFMKEVPFKDIHIHALVRDPTGQKMSKSKGNVVDPLSMMKKYGTDAFRFTLTAFAAQGRDIKLDESRIEGYRNFSNKIWNATRYVMMKASPYYQKADFDDLEIKSSGNQWILYELNQTIKDVENGILNYQFNKSAASIYKFFWQSFCSWYLELSKEIFDETSTYSNEVKIETSQTITYVLDQSLRLLHPFMPFITEEIWHLLSDDREGQSIALASYPKVNDNKAMSYQKAWQDLDQSFEIVEAIRNIRQEIGIPPSEELEAFIQENQSDLHYDDRQICSLSRSKSLSQKLPAGPLAKSKTSLGNVGVALQSLIDRGIVDLNKEVDRQKKKLAKVEKDKMQLDKQLGNENFVKNAPDELIVEKKELLKKIEEQKLYIEEALKDLEL